MSDLISLQIKQLKEAKYILKLWMINYIKKKTECEITPYQRTCCPKRLR